MSELIKALQDNFEKSLKSVSWANPYKCNNCNEQNETVKLFNSDIYLCAICREGVK